MAMARATSARAILQRLRGLSSTGGQPLTTDPPWTFTAIRGSGRGAGPERFFPVARSYVEPWHGQTSMFSATPTMQPMWVHVALKATIFPLVGCETTTEAPSLLWTTTAPPTGTWDTFA